MENKRIIILEEEAQVYYLPKLSETLQTNYFCKGIDKFFISISWVQRGWEVIPRQGVKQDDRVENRGRGGDEP